MGSTAAAKEAAAAAAAKHAREREIAAASEGLPPGWVRMESRSRPGQFYYAHPATQRTQVERPVAEGRGKSAAVSQRPVSNPQMPSATVSRPAPAPIAQKDASSPSTSRKETQDATSIV